MKVLDLFSGIGGFSLAAQRVGWETVAFCEIDSYCQKVLAKRWPGVPIYDDIARFNGVDADIITGGFPCQDFSRLGQRSGLEGKHSGLWSEFLRIIRIVRPKFVVVENVPEMLVRGIGDILGDLAASGYDAEWEGIPAAALGANHLRARQWILAYPASLGDRLQEETILPRWLAPECGNWWASEPSIRRMDDGVSTELDACRTDRLRGLGNAIVPQVAQVIFEAINGATT